jgi:hypothetical protein
VRNSMRGILFDGMGLNGMSGLGWDRMRCVGMG